MIEVEKKFLLTPEEEARLLDGAESHGEKVITDGYLDNASYDLTLADKWLRLRDGRYELKVRPAGHQEGFKFNQYHELETDDEIREALGLPDGDDLGVQLTEAGFSVFCLCKSTRRGYDKEGFVIDLDAVTYEGSDFRTSIAEIELQVTDDSEVQAAVDKIVGFAAKHGIEQKGPVLGKVAAFLKQENPDHYRLLVDAKVLPDA